MEITNLNSQKALCREFEFAFHRLRLTVFKGIFAA